MTQRYSIDHETERDILNIVDAINEFINYDEFIVALEKHHLTEHDAQWFIQALEDYSQTIVNTED